MKRSIYLLILFIISAILMVSQGVFGQSSDGQHLEIMLQRLESLNDTGELDRLIAEGKKLADSPRATAEKCLELSILIYGKILFGNGQKDPMADWKEAIQYLEKAITLSHEFALAHAILGHFYLFPFLKDEQALNKAKNRFQAALDLDPGLNVAKEGMRRIALRSSPLAEKERFFKENLDNLARVTRSGIVFKIQAVKIEDSIQHSEVVVYVAVSNVSRSDIIKSVEAMRYMGRIAGAKKPERGSKTIGGIIRLVGEVSGLTYSCVSGLDLSLDRMGVVLQLPQKGTVCRLLTPISSFEKRMKKQMTTSQLFGSMTYVSH